MRKLSNINENVFDDMLKRNQGTDERRENFIKTNIDDLKCGLHMGNIYWADDYLEIIEKDDEGVKISLNEFNKIKREGLKGWRLPTQDEFRELFRKGHLYSDALESRVYDNPGCTGNNVLILSYRYVQMEESDSGNCMNFDEVGAIHWKKISDPDISELKYRGQEYWLTVLLVREDKI